MIRFAGTGEPLLHKDIAKMVEYAVKMNVAEAVDIVTNGLLLEPDLSDKLIAAGLSSLEYQYKVLHLENMKRFPVKKSAYQNCR